MDIRRTKTSSQAEQKKKKVDLVLGQDPMVTLSLSLWLRVIYQCSGNFCWQRTKWKAPHEDLATFEVLRDVQSFLSF